MTSFALHAVVGFVDMLFVAQLGSEPVAGVGLASQVFMLSFALIGGVTTGTVALVARSSGAGDPAESSRITRASMILTSVLCGLLMLLAGPSSIIFHLFGVTPGVYEVASRYLGISLLASIPLGVNFVISSGLRGAGDVRTPLLVGIGINILNIVGDYALIFGHFGFPAMGAAGSAVASAASFSLGALVFLILWVRGWLLIPCGPLLPGIDRDLCRRLLTIGLPTAAEQLAFNFGLFTFLRLVTTFGTEAVSAYMIGVRILAFSFIPGLGFATAAATLVGQYLGAHRPEEAEHAGWRATGGALGVMTGIGLVIILLAEPIASWFGAAGAETTELTVTFIYILGAAQPLMAIEFSIAGALRGAGDTRYPLFALLLGLFVFRLGLASVVLFVFEGSLVAVWSCLLADYLVKATLLVIRFRRGAWKHLQI
jgi:putative MATE family efflux protein